MTFSVDFKDGHSAMMSLEEFQYMRIDPSSGPGHGHLNLHVFEQKKPMRPKMVLAWLGIEKITIVNDV